MSSSDYPSSPTLNSFQSSPEVDLLSLPSSFSFFVGRIIESNIDSNICYYLFACLSFVFCQCSDSICLICVWCCVIWRDSCQVFFFSFFSLLQRMKWVAGMDICFFSLLDRFLVVSIPNVNDLFFVVRFSIASFLWSVLFFFLLIFSVRKCLSAQMRGFIGVVFLYPLNGYKG